MNTKELIMNVALEIAYEKGLANVTLSSIADKIGIKKPSIYNHFISKEKLIEEMYNELRERALQSASIDFTIILDMLKSSSPEKIMSLIVEEYIKMNSSDNINRFYKIVEAEKYYDINAALIIIEETHKMCNITKKLFKEFSDRNILKCKNIDVAAYSFAYTIHGMITELGLREMCNKNHEEYKKNIYEYIENFMLQYKINEV